MGKSNLTYEELEERRLAKLAEDTMNDYKSQIAKAFDRLNKEEFIQHWRERFEAVDTLYLNGGFNTYEDYIIERQYWDAALRQEPEFKLITECAESIGKTNVQMCADYLAQVDNYIPLVETTAQAKTAFTIKATVKDSFNVKQTNVINHLKEAVTTNPVTGKMGIYSTHNHVKFKGTSMRNTYNWSNVKATNIIMDSIENGKSVYETKKAFYDMQGSNMAAAERNARTSITSARNWGTLDTMKQAEEQGINIKKKWVTTMDGRTRDVHARMNGETVGVDDKFSNGLKYPGDSSGPPAEVYNCRCTMESVIDGHKEKTTTAAEYVTWMEDNGVSYSDYHNAAQGALTRSKTVTATNASGETMTFGSVNELKKYFNSTSTVEYGKEFTKGKYKGWTFSK